MSGQVDEHGIRPSNRNADIQKLIESMQSIQDGELAADALVGIGQRAVPLLRKFLLFGRPSTVHQPRQRAVRALAELGAKDVLIEYLTSRRPIVDAAVRFGEEAVENTAARALAAWKTEDVFQTMLAIARSRTLPGIIEALGVFGRSEALPYLIAALGDDVSRRDAEHALRSMGDMALSGLLDAARTPDPSRRDESPASLVRRRSALRLIASFPGTPETWPKIEPLLMDDDVEIAVSAATLALKLGDDANKRLAVRRLIDVLPAANWLIQSEIEGLLLENFSFASGLIQQEIQKRSNIPRTHWSKEITLRLLLNVVHQAGTGSSRR